MDRHRPIRTRDVAVLIGALLATAAVGAGLRLIPDVSPTTTALALLLVVLATATLGRLWIATVIAIVAMLTLNFFFLPPVGTFTVADPQNWVALFAFLVVAVIAGNLSAAAQTRAQEAIARRNEVTRLFDLTRDVLLTTETGGAIDALARHVARRFELTGVAICLPGDRGWHVHQGGGTEVSVDETIDPRVASAALSHLLENAAHYSPTDREIAVDAHVQPNGLHVVVTDHGPGLDPGELEHLFERFYRGQSARQVAAGTGMGLAITRGLLTAAGGRVWGENVPGAGARFTMVIPGRARTSASPEGPVKG